PVPSTLPVRALVGRDPRPAPSPASPPSATPCSRSFFFNDTPTTEIYTLSLHDALPILSNLQSFIASMTQKLTLSDISDESKVLKIGRAVQQECRDRSRMPSSA